MRLNWMRTRLLCLLAVLIILRYWLQMASPVFAQSPAVNWSEPINLSNTPQSSGHPAIVADEFGYVHVFWSEDVGGEPMQPDDHVRTGNTIFYTRWDGVSWTAPVDILFVPGDSIAEHVAVDVDAENRLHAVWTGMFQFYYSSAPSWQANSAQAWNEPVKVAADSARSRWESDIVADASGNLHIVYAIRGNQAGVYHIRSEDEGTTWRSAAKLSEPLDAFEKGFSNVKVITDDAGRLHAVWQTNDEEGYGQAVYYARTIDKGETWSTPVQLRYAAPDEEFVAWPYITAKAESELHMIYTNGSNKGRAHRISIDGGETWSEPYEIIMDMEGVNGYVVPLIDGAGGMHLIVNMRTRATQIGGIYYAVWLGTGWSPVAPVATEAPYASSAHYTAAAVRLGNELHVVWNQIRGGEIGHMRGMLPAVNPVPALALPPPLTPSPTPTIAPATPRPAAQRGQQPIALAAPSPVASPAVNPLLPGVGAALLLVAGVIAWTRIRSR